jgi:hypothetical protein
MKKYKYKIQKEPKFPNLLCIYRKRLGLFSWLIFWDFIDAQNTLENAQHSVQVDIERENQKIEVIEEINPWDKK